MEWLRQDSAVPVLIDFVSYGILLYGGQKKKTRRVSSFKSVHSPGTESGMKCSSDRSVGDTASRGSCFIRVYASKAIRTKSPDPKIVNQRKPTVTDIHVASPLEHPIKLNRYIRLLFECIMISVPPSSLLNFFENMLRTD